MPLVNRKLLIQSIEGTIDNLLATQLVDEFISIERRYIQGDWEPAELDGGQFAEIVARIIYSIDSSNINRDKSFEDCNKYISNNDVSHSSYRKDFIHISKTLQVIYKFRSQRGAVHISSTYTPNHMDAKLIVECSRWVFAEILRLFWNGDRNAVAKAIREILEFDVPCIGEFGGTLLVQRTDLRAEEEILLLLHYSGEAGASRSQIGSWALVTPPTVTRCLQRLTSPDSRQIFQLSDGNYRITGLGEKRVRTELADKLKI